MNKKVKGGALYYAVFISFLFTLIAFLFLYTTQIHNQYADYYVKSDQLRDNLQSALNKYLSDNSILDYNAYTNIDLFNDGKDSAFISKEHWGAFDLINVKTGWTKLNFSKFFLTGAELKKGSPVAIYMIENESYLSISGNTLIKGNAWLPKLGIRTSYIEGSGYKNDKTVYGEIFKSEKKLVEPEKSFVEFVKKYLTMKFDDKDSLIKFETAIALPGILNHFINRVVVLYSSNEILIDKGFSLKGKIIVCADKKITISKDAEINNVLFFAPFIKISDGFSGNLQAFASDTIEAGEGCELKYPSYLCIYSEEDIESKIEISKSCKIEGGILMWQEKTQDKKPFIQLKDDTEITGQIYTNGPVEVRGKVNGSVYCSGFILKNPSAIYENHLLNAIIDFTAIPDNFAGYDATMKNNKSQTIKCLY